MPHRTPRLPAAAVALSLAAPAATGLAQTAPVNGIRPAEVRTHAIVGATVVAAPGRSIEDASIVIREGVITAVGPDIEIPTEARVRSGDGLTVYAGLIDPAVLVEAEQPDGAGAHWNDRVRPQVAMAGQAGPDSDLREELRKLGFTAAAIYPAGGIFRGSGAVIALADEDEHVLAYDERAAMAVGLDDRASERRSYPSSLMGTIALIRQTLYDAQWYDVSLRVWRENPLGHEPPARAEALAALADVVLARQPVLFDVADEHNALRAARIADELSLQGILLGSGYEFRRLDEIAAVGLPIIVPLKYPKTPSVSSLLEADDVSLRELMTWEQAPTNVRRLVEAGVTVALTTHRLKKRGTFHEALARAIEHGLSQEQALAALTTTPARLLGLEQIIGTIEVGKVANLVVVEGSLFDTKPTIRDTWVNGRRHEISPRPEVTFVGSATLTASTGLETGVEIDTDKAKLTIRLPDGTKQKAGNVVVQRDRLSFVLEGGLFETDGYVRLTGLLTEGRVIGTGVLPDGSGLSFTIIEAVEEASEPGQVEQAGQIELDTPVEEPAPAAGPPAATDPEPDPIVVVAAAGDDGVDDGETDDADTIEAAAVEPPPQQLLYPLGAYGLSIPPQRQDVVITNATIWTGGVDGIIDEGVLYVRDGRVAWVGSVARFREPTDGVTVIDAAGRHVTPGLIDCHSHTGINGGVNEMGQAITAEVRIRDVTNPDDINFYRALAGGLTAANQLHGSANPIGGQNCVIKLKWSAPAREMRIDDAVGGIKFALGENVKRSRGRYPNSRMGVEAIIRDAFLAAIDYREKWDAYLDLGRAEQQRTIPPRRDLELDALIEILDGQRIVHCHSYRQDEILMLIRLADELGFTIGTFQHVLEGYKVAEAIAAHGAGASAFSDWWAYKVEVMDAIPFNGALMHDVGVLVSFNSDSSELARRMNTEASKAVRYGGVDPHEALKFVTINPARQLRIDDRTGSLEAGKDADFAIWSESPLSTYARCEQTWIEGARYFDLESDRDLRQRDEAERRRLVQKILADAGGKSPPSEAPDAAPDVPPAEDDRPYSCCWSHQR